MTWCNPRNAYICSIVTYVAGNVNWEMLANYYKQIFLSIIFGLPFLPRVTTSSMPTLLNAYNSVDMMNKMSWVVFDLIFLLGVFHGCLISIVILYQVLEVSFVLIIVWSWIIFTNKITWIWVRKKCSFKLILIKLVSINELNFS